MEDTLISDTYDKINETLDKFDYFVKQLLD